MLAILERAGFAPGVAARLVQVLTGRILGPAIHRATTQPPGSRGGTAGAPDTIRRGVSVPGPRHRAALGLVEGPDLDQLTIELWVGGVEALVAHGTGSGSPDEPDPDPAA